ncbi:putative membrane protein YhdT [Volucribacter psittacicida]|uniref:Putative membrane protein YhdT n=1 Tax=Volucribacter psittacicida TaxID=203482 RepID=A0A4R1FTW5_9PAST|nr:DUF997 family protein [Volucribacter psittacicida]TCJ98297.1 putative membrane protein YhdT [Volucribacter psittacicida]
MEIKFRYQQATKEAKWALFATILYLIGWCLCAYFPPHTTGLLGFPLWFELSCLYLPIVFIAVAYWIIKVIYQDISLDHQDKSENKS